TMPVTDTYDEAWLDFISAVPPPDSTAAGALQWLNVGPLLEGGMTSIVIQFTADAETVGPAFNEAVVSATMPLVPPQTSSAPYTIFPVGVVSGSVFEDENADGVFDPEDTNGLAGVVVTLSDSNRNPVATNLTDGAGLYTFTNVLPGTWYLAETDPAGFISTGDRDGTNDNEITVVLGLGMSSAGNDFLDTQPGSLSGLVLDDQDADGVIDSDDTNGLANLTVTLNDTNGVMVQTTMTDASGAYTFTGILAGVYRIVETDPGGFMSSGDSDGPNDNEVGASLTSGQTVGGHDFLDFANGTINGSVLQDVDADGVLDPEDTNGIANVTVVLTDTNGLMATPATTDAAGDFVFMNVPPGPWLLTETDPAGFVSSGDSDGANDNRIVVIVTSGGTSGGNTFLDFRLGSIFGSVRPEADADGVG
ncbi:MAG: SdrD B-like domain-containing protein, partial [Verrucomicrobiota bacterium]